MRTTQYVECNWCYLADFVSRNEKKVNTLSSIDIEPATGLEWDLVNLRFLGRLSSLSSAKWQRKYKFVQRQSEKDLLFA